MHWVEIINARMADISACRELQHMFLDLQEQLDGEMHYQVRLVVYRNDLVENDLSMHLHWTTAHRPTGKSELGIKLAELLRTLALVDHTVWVESVIQPSTTPPPSPLANQTKSSGHSSLYHHRRTS